ncbi:heme exporter protein CcmD [Labrys monachus]|uniref:Heme exporter protein D n=1 Tax=Labrys monachus TaxID=217067 RepID=A0ABU0FQ65_9HYPH|nr:heme exporter protein CcmD [Labrys monachus]MDQ0396198.1 heme exporter protein D [Labrys monachus]
MVVLGMDLGPHWAFITWAYGLAIAVIAALAAWILVDYRSQLKTLAELEARGLRRRSRSRTEGAPR